MPQLKGSPQAGTGASDRRSKSDQHAMSQFNLTPVARVALLKGSISGVREIDSYGSILAVHAAPFSQLDRMRANSAEFDYITYVLDTESTPAMGGVPAKSATGSTKKPNGRAKSTLSVRTTGVRKIPSILCRGAANRHRRQFGRPAREHCPSIWPRPPQGFRRPRAACSARSVFAIGCGVPQV
jgi:hypothetical protein